MTRGTTRPRRRSTAAAPSSKTFKIKLPPKIKASTLRRGLKLTATAPAKSGKATRRSTTVKVAQ